MIGLGSPVLGLEPVSYVCHQEAAVIRHVIRGWVKEKEKKRERSSREVAFAFRKGEKGEKRLFRSMNISFILVSAIRELFFRGRKNSNEILDVKRRLWTRLEWKELIFFYGNFNTMFYTGKRCLITIKYSKCVTNLAPHLYNRGNYY